MRIHRLIMIGTVAIVLSLGAGTKPSSAEAVLSQIYTKESADSSSDRFLPALGAAGQEEVWDALYQGRSLADIAEANGKHAQDVIDLQIAQLSEQLQRRMESGQLSKSDYQAQMMELPAIVTASVYGNPDGREAAFPFQSMASWRSY